VLSNKEIAQQLQIGEDLALIALLWNPMLRLSEVANLNVEDIKSLDGDAPTVKFVGKGRSEPEELPLAPSTVNALRRWVQLRKRKASPSSALFVRVRPRLDVHPGRDQPGYEMDHGETIPAPIQSRFKFVCPAPSQLSR
jgi:site-specific recombinase XerC